jgi:hypothetical protein
MFGPGGATVFMLGTAALSAVESRIRGGTVESVAVARKGGGIVVDVVAII